MKSEIKQSTVVKQKAYAKINSFLSVTERRENGYHTILSHMQGVTLCDFIEVRRISQTNACGMLTTTAEIPVKLICDQPGIPTGEKNLAVRAARSYFSALSEHTCPKADSIEIYLEKKIPLAAGLAGGSADAAAVLKALNRLYGDKFSLTELCEIGADIGADVPFCLRAEAGAQTARGIGELLEKAPDIPSAWYLVLACSGNGVSTPAAYAALDRSGLDEKEAIEERYVRLKKAIAEGNELEFEKNSYNVFEAIVAQDQATPEILCRQMRKGGAIAARMSGSGPTVVGFFKEEKLARQMAGILLEEHMFAVVCRPLSKATAAQEE